MQAKRDDATRLTVSHAAPSGSDQTRSTAPSTGASTGLSGSLSNGGPIEPIPDDVIPAENAPSEHNPVGSPKGAAQDAAPTRPSYTTRSEVESLGISLGPALHEACGDRLGDIEWFQSPWQKSGAATGMTAWRLPSGQVIDAIVKAPVGYREYFWSSRLGVVDPMWWESEECAHLPVPRVVAEGTELGGYDIAWIVQERIAGQTVAKQIDADRLRQLFLAAARFHAHTREIKRAERIDPVGEPDWRSVLDRARRRATDNAIERLDEWLRAIRAVEAVLPALLDRWHARPMDTWCHGDLHPGNCMIRDDCLNSSEGGQADPRCGVLIDFSLVHPGHWVEDALYLERMYWGREDALMGVEPVRCLAEYRLLLGLHADDTDERLADIRRLLMGVTSPAFLRHENDPVYLDAALERVLKLIPKTGGSL